MDVARRTPIAVGLVRSARAGQFTLVAKATYQASLNGSGARHATTSEPLRQELRDEARIYFPSDFAESKSVCDVALVGPTLRAAGPVWMRVGVVELQAGRALDLGPIPQTQPPACSFAPLARQMPFPSLPIYVEARGTNWTMQMSIPAPKPTAALVIRQNWSAAIPLELAIDGILVDPMRALVEVTLRAPFQYGGNVDREVLALCDGRSQVLGAPVAERMNWPRAAAVEPSAPDSFRPVSRTISIGRATAPMTRTPSNTIMVTRGGSGSQPFATPSPPVAELEEETTTSDWGPVWTTSKIPAATPVMEDEPTMDTSDDRITTLAPLPPLPPSPTRATVANVPVAEAMVPPSQGRAVRRPGFLPNVSATAEVEAEAPKAFARTPSQTATFVGGLPGARALPFSGNPPDTAAEARAMEETAIGSTATIREGAVQLPQWMIAAQSNQSERLASSTDATPFQPSKAVSGEAYAPPLAVPPLAPAPPAVVGVSVAQAPSFMKAPPGAAQASSEPPVPGYPQVGGQLVRSPSLTQREREMARGIVVEGMSLERYSTIRAALWTEGAKRREVLKTFDLSELKWRMIERRWVQQIDAMSKDAGFVSVLSALQLANRSVAAAVSEAGAATAKDAGGVEK